MKKDKDIRDKFKAAEAAMEIDAGRKGQSLWILGQAAGHKAVFTVCGKGQMVRNVFWYMDKTLWGGHLLVSALTVLVVGRLWQTGAGREEMMAAAILLSGLAGVFSVLAICHGFGSNMAELGESCYFNASQMVMFRMVYFCVANLMLLTSGILFMGWQWRIPLLQIGLYLLVPFLLTWCCCLAAALTETGRKVPCLPGLAGSLALLFCLALSMVPGIYYASALSFWAAAFGAGALWLGLQIKRLFCEIEKGEILCMN